MVTDSAYPENFWKTMGGPGWVKRSKSVMFMRIALLYQVRQRAQKVLHNAGKRRKNG
jgi:hypothetical protein